MQRARITTWALAAVWLALTPSAFAQWTTQTNNLKSGWNAVYLHVDASHTNINGLVGIADPIEEIWLWNTDLPPGLALVQPQSPAPGSQWSTWTRANGTSSELQTLRGNSAMLVRVTEGIAGFAWKVKGRPVPPSYRWNLNGLNFVGFPVNPTTAPTLDTFLTPDAQPLDWLAGAEIFRYPGGPLSATNPQVVSPIAFRATPVRRDQAYWIRTGDLFNQYFGPIQVSGVGSGGLKFGDTLSSFRLVLKNTAKTSVTVTLNQVESEPAPSGQPASTGPVPLLVRGALRTADLTYGYTTLSDGPQNWTLAPKGQIGSEAEVIIGVNRSRMTGPAGSLYTSVLRVTDSLGLLQVDLAASATTSSRNGLWVGSATVGYVSQYLKPYAKAESSADFEALLARLQLAQGGNGYRYEWDPNTGRVLVFGGPDGRRGSYLLDGPVKLDSGGVARSFPLRLILHNSGNAVSLLQRAYVGVGLASSNQVVATREEALLPAQLASARRISATHLPTSDSNIPWTFSGTMEEGGVLSTTVALAHDDHSSNPFLHSYHPNHDNLDALFEENLPAGVESYGVRRVISLRFTPMADHFDGLTRGSGRLGGNYAETLTFIDQHGDTKEFNALGTFTLQRIIDIATLTTQ